MLRKGELSYSRDEYLNGYPIYVVILKQYNIQSTVIGLRHLHLYIYSFTGMYVTIIKKIETMNLKVSRRHVEGERKCNCILIKYKQYEENIGSRKKLR